MRQIHTQVKIFSGDKSNVEREVNNWLSLKGYTDIIELKQSVVANLPSTIPSVTLVVSIFYKVEK